MVLFTDLKEMLLLLLLPSFLLHAIAIIKFRLLLRLLVVVATSLPFIRFKSDAFTMILF